MVKACFFSRFALHVLLKFRRCAEERIAREWTRWKPRDQTASYMPPTIPRTPCDTASGRSVVPRDLMPFLTRAE
jgi:hypothetical protein